MSAEFEFEFTLAHAGVPNLNGDCFEFLELNRATPSVVGAKVNLSHDDSLAGVIGKVTSARFVAEGGGRVECTATLFTDSMEAARAAKRLVEEGIIGAVSLECDFGEAECSVCGQRFKTGGVYCNHLSARHADGSAFRILRDVRFTGVALLEPGKQADPSARIAASSSVIARAKQAVRATRRQSELDAFSKRAEVLVRVAFDAQQFDR